MRIEVPTEVKMVMLAFCILMPCGLVDENNLSKELTATTFRAEVRI
jgi:fumarate reductase subunit D